MRSLKMFSDFRHYRKVIYQVFLASFAIQILSLAQPIAFLVVIDKVIGNNGLTTLYSIIFGLSIAVIIEGLLLAARTYTMSHLSILIDVQLSEKLYRHLLQLAVPFFSKMPVGDISHRFNDARKVREYFVQSLPLGLIDLMFCILYFVVLFIISPLLTMIVMVAVIAMIGSTLSFMPFEAKRAEKQNSGSVANQQMLIESLVGIETVKTLQIEEQFLTKWMRQLADYGDAANHLGASVAISSQLVDFITKAATVAILGFGAIAILSQTLTLGQLIAFNLICMRMWQPIMRGAKLWHDYRTAGISLRRIKELLQEPVETNAALGIDDTIAGSIVFENVSFAYPQIGAPDVVANASFTINPGEIIGIEGHSGSGKSTLARLVLGLYNPTQGRVLVDGDDLNLWDKGQLRNQIGVVLQDNYLFAGTVRENIACRNPDMRLRDIVALAKLVDAHDFIIALPGGYDMPIRERGQSLSMGQRQRIAFARALASDPKILILDEATSALDDASQARILANFNEIAQGRTVLVIAHKEEILEITSRRLRLTKGGIIVNGE